MKAKKDIKAGDRVILIDGPQKDYIAEVKKVWDHPMTGRLLTIKYNWEGKKLIRNYELRFVEHYPDSWEVAESETGRHGYDDWNTYTIRDKANHCLAVVGAVDRATSDDNLYSAKLMAKSPELLKILKRLTSRASHQFDFSNSEKGAINCEVLREAFAVIDEIENQ